MFDIYTTEAIEFNAIDLDGNLTPTTIKKGTIGNVSFRYVNGDVIAKINGVDTLILNGTYQQI